MLYTILLYIHTYIHTYTAYVGRPVLNALPNSVPSPTNHLSHREMELPKEAARSLQFPPGIVALADKVIDGIEQATGNREFNGIHLRLESDSRDWSEILGGRDVRCHVVHLRFLLGLSRWFYFLAGMASPPAHRRFGKITSTPFARLG